MFMNEMAQQQATGVSDLIIPLVTGLSILFGLVANWLRRRINESATENTALKVRLGVVEEQNTTAEAKITDLMREVVKRDGKIQEQTNTHIREIMELEQKFDLKLTEANGRIGIMEGAVHVLESANNTLSEALDKTVQENENLREQKDVIDKQQADYRTEQTEKMTEGEQKIEQLELENQLLRAEYAELKRAYETLEQRVDELIQSTNGKPAVNATESVTDKVKE